jgi:DDE superfamily endonuclease
VAYSVVAVLESGRSSWTAPLDAVRLVPGQDATEVTAGQIREVWARLRTAEQWRDGDPPVLVVTDAGYDVIRLAFLLRDLPVRLLGRVRADRRFHAPVPAYPGTGRPGRHGPAMKLDDPATWPAPACTATSVHERYGNVAICAWGYYHPQLQRRAGWAAHPGALPIVEGTLVHVTVDRLPGDRTPKPVWLWHSQPEPAELDVLRLFRIFLRRFDLEHTFRFLKQTLGWTRPRLRHPDQADPGRLHAATAGPRPDRRSAPPLGEAIDPRPAHPGPCPARVFPHPPENRPSRQRTETLPTRPRPPERNTQQSPGASLHRW